MEPLSLKMTIRDLLSQFDDGLESEKIPSSCLSTWHGFFATWHQHRDLILASRNADLRLEVLPSDVYQGIVQPFDDFREMKDDSRQERVRQQEEKARKQMALRSGISSEFRI